MNSFYSEEELKNIGFAKFGKNVLISRNSSIYSPSNITIGNNVRIDDFCILSGKIKIGSFVHISAYTAIYGKYGVQMEDYTGLSPRCTIFSAMDDFTGDFLIGPMHNPDFINITGGEVIIKRFSQIGSGATIFPNITIEEGVAVGAMSLVNIDLDCWGIYAGIPVKRIKDRNKGLLEFIE